MPSLRVVVWNTEWARAQTPRGQEIARIVRDAAPDIACVTEGFEELLPDHGHLIDSDPDYGYRQHEGRRKVLMWSQEPWRDVDRVGDPAMPGGRFVAGTTHGPVGPVRVIGVCIPWRDAHVRTGRKDREPWEDHKRFLAGIENVLGAERDRPQLVVGDFNQRIPRYRTPKPVFELMTEVFAPRFFICTSGELPGTDGLSIDHLAHTDDLQRDAVDVFPRVTDEGLRLSDHFGLRVDLSKAIGQPSV